MPVSSVQLRNFSEEYVHEARDLLVDIIHRRGPVHTCLNSCEERAIQKFSIEYLRQCAQDGLSVLALDTNNGHRVVGVSLVCITTPPRREPPVIKHLILKLKAQVDLSAILGKQARVAELGTAVVHDGYTGQGIFTRMLEMVAEMFKQRNISYMGGMFSSSFSRKAALKVGFEMVASVKYADFEYEGEKPLMALAEDHQEFTYGVLKVM